MPIISEGLERVLNEIGGGTAHDGRMLHTHGINRKVTSETRRRGLVLRTRGLIQQNPHSEADQVKPIKHQREWIADMNKAGHDL